MAVRTMTARRVLSQLSRWIRAVPVVRFNSQRYGLNVLKSLLMRRLVCVDTVDDFGDGDGDDGDGGDNKADDAGDGDHNDGDCTTGCSSSDSGNSDGCEAGDEPLYFVVKHSNALTVIET